MHTKKIPLKDQKAMVLEIDKYLSTQNISKEVAQEVKNFLINSGGSILTILTSGEESSVFSAHALENLGLRQELFVRFNEIIDSKSYIEPHDLFQDLRSFFILNYPIIDVAIYKYMEKRLEDNKSIRYLKLVTGDEKFCSKNITLVAGGGSFSLEKKAVRTNGFHKNLKHRKEGGMAAFKISFNLFENTKECYIVSFWFRDLALTSSENKDERFEALKRIETFIKRGNLETTIRTKLATLREFIDDLTGLYNKKYVNAIQNQPYSLLMIDINDFKQYNDRNGHQAGDLALKELGQVFRDSIRFSDRACRNGGDEFLLFISSGRNQANELQTLRLIKQRINDKIKALNSKRPADKQYGITIGHSVFNPEKSFALRLKEADDNMFHEKPTDGRRNRIVSQIREFMANEHISDIRMLMEQLMHTISASDKRELIEMPISDSDSIYEKN